MKKNNELLNLAEALVAYGRKKGADQVEVAIGEGTGFSVDVLEGSIEKLVEAGSKGLSLKVIKDEKVATASSSDFSIDTLHTLIENAVTRAAVSSRDEFSALPEKEEIGIDPAALRMYDPDIPALPPEAKIAIAKKIEKRCLADSRIRKSYGANMSTSVSSVYLANSRGFSGFYARTSVNSGVYLQAGSGDNLFDEGKYSSGRNLADMMAPEAIADEAIHRVTRLIGARKISSERMPVVFEPAMTGSLLGFLAGCVNGNAIYMKQSFLCDRLGEKIGNEKVTIIDDGRIPGAPGTRPFDGEGVPTRKTVVLDKGVLKNYLLNTYAARKLGMSSTGNGSGTNNFYLAAGAHSPDEIIASVSRGLLLTSTMGQGTIPTTGDISKGAFGMLIENGNITEPVAEITISGNLGEILANVEMVGNDLKFDRSVTGPTILANGIMIGGK